MKINRGIICPYLFLLTIFLRKCEFTFLGLYTDRRKNVGNSQPATSTQIDG